MTITVDDSDTVLEALLKIQSVILALLQRQLSDSARGAVMNLGTCVSAYIFELEHHEKT